MIRPTRRGILLFVAGIPVATGAVFAPGLWLVWLVFAAGCALLAGGDALLAVRPEDVRVSARAPQMLFVGEDPGELELVVTAPEPLRAEALVVLDPILAQQPTRIAIAGEPLRIRLQPLRRGTARIEALWLRWTGPLGLVYREKRHALDLEIAVAPNVRAVRRAALRFFTQRQFLSGLKVERYVGDGSEFEALREYMPGLDHRAISWKASARHRKLLSQEFRAERNHQVVAAVDTGRLMREPLEGLARLDHAVNGALLLSYFALRTGDRVGLFGFDERVRCWAEPQGGAHSFPVLQRASAALQYGTSETNFTLGLLDLSARLRRRSLVVLLTDFVDTVTAELMLDNVERLTRRHLVVFVALRDPALDAFPAARPGGLDDLHRAVVTFDLLRDRELVLRRLRRLGIHVVDARPSDVSVQLLNRYFDIKRRELV